VQKRSTRADALQKRILDLPEKDAISEKLGPISVQRRCNSRGWLHRAFPRKRHQQRHLVSLHRLVRRQTLYPTELRAH